MAENLIPNDLPNVLQTLFNGLASNFQNQQMVNAQNIAVQQTVQAQIQDLTNIMHQGIQNQANGQQLPQYVAPTMSFNCELPRFDGTSDFDSWIGKLRRIFRAKNCLNTLDAIHWAFTCLDGSALQFAESHNFTDFDDFSSKMRERFVPANEIFHLRARLNRLKQHGDDYEKYYNDFSTLSAKIPNMQEPELMWFFMQGLPAHVHQEVLYRQPATLADVQNVARAYQQARKPIFGPVHFSSSASSSNSSEAPMDLDYMAHSSRRSNRSPYRPNKFRGRSSSHSSSGSRGSRSPYRRHNSRSPAKHNRVSFHPVNTASISKNDKRANQSPLRFPSKSKRECTFCGRAGHIRAQCFRLHDSSNNKAPRTPSPKHSPRSGNERGSR